MMNQDRDNRRGVIRLRLTHAHNFHYVKKLDLKPVPVPRTANDTSSNLKENYPQPSNPHDSLIEDDEFSSLNYINSQPSAIQSGSRTNRNLDPTGSLSYNKEQNSRYNSMDHANPNIYHTGSTDIGDSRRTHANTAGYDDTSMDAVRNLPKQDFCRMQFQGPLNETSYGRQFQKKAKFSYNVSKQSLQARSRLQKLVKKGEYLQELEKEMFCKVKMKNNAILTGIKEEIEWVRNPNYDSEQIEMDEATFMQHVADGKCITETGHRIINGINSAVTDYESPRKFPKPLTRDNSIDLEYMSTLKSQANQIFKNGLDTHGHMVTFFSHRLLLISQNKILSPNLPPLLELTPPPNSLCKSPKFSSSSHPTNP